MSEEIILKIVENVGDDAKAIIILLGIFDLITTIIIPLGVALVLGVLGKILVNAFQSGERSNQILNLFDLNLYGNSRLDIREAKQKIKDWQARDEKEKNE